MKQWKWAAMMAVLLCLVCGAALAENQYYAVRAPIEINAAEPAVLTLDAKEGWMWNITDNTDVTAWLVREDGSPAFADAEGIASAKLIYGKVENEENEVAVALEITIDAAIITGFTANGSYDLYVLPTGKSTIWVCGGNFSPQGGDGNGHYDFRIGISGIRYNGLPLSEAIVRTDFYSFGRTFLTEGGSLILGSEPAWTSDAEIPVICDVYPDTVAAAWPIGFDASGLTENDVTVTLISAYGDEMTLEPGKDFAVAASAGRTEITLNYIYWAYAPVYTTMRVTVNTENTDWNELMYRPAASFSHDYQIGSVYIYSVMSGGPGGTQAWTFFGLNNLTDSHQVYMDATYTLTAADAEGNVFFYGEDENGKGIRVLKEADAVAFNCDKECNVHLEGDTVYYSRLFDQTEEKEIDGETIIFNKNYYNCESLLRPVDSLIDVELAPGYAIGAGWEDHLKWPWQTFVDVGFKGGSK